jgi:ribosomal protein S18 acetylase RimI-like enzyme
MTTIALRRMSESEYSTYLSVAIPNYANEKMKGEGLTLEQAKKVATESFGNLLPDGLKTKNHFFFSVAHKGSEGAVGTVWFGKKEEKENSSSAFIYDLILNSELRGKGLGKQLMRLVEIEVRKLGLKSIGLHVFGHNTIATRLYESSGFLTTNRIMKKDLI